MRQKSIFGEETAGGLFSILPEYLFDPKGLLKNIPLSALTDPELAEALAKEEPRLQDFAESFNSDPYSRDPALLKGCGPYELVSWETGQRIVLRKKANWWGDRLAKNRPTFQDADEIIREVFQGFGQRIAAPVPLSVDYYPKALKPIPFNLEKAKSLLAQAGWKDTDNNGIVDKTAGGKKTELKLTYLLNASSETSRNIGLPKNPPFCWINSKRATLSSFPQAGPSRPFGILCKTGILREITAMDLGMPKPTP